MLNQPQSLPPEKAVAFVVARLNSSRLPQKQFRRIGDRSVLDWIIYQLQKCRRLDDIVIATAAEEANEPLRQYCRERHISCFWYEGHIDHVTTRLRRAAEAHGADLCVLISGDCPLIYAPIVDVLVQELRRHPEAAFVQVPPLADGRRAALEGVSVARRRAWQLADDLSDLPELKEHHFPVMRLRPELFRPVACSLPEDLYFAPHRLSIDTHADLEFMHKLYDEVRQHHAPFELPEILTALRRRPQLRLLNSHVHQKALREVSHPVLCIVDAGPDYGYGHLMRSRELALQITERLGWPVTFLVDDPQAANLLESRGLHVHWGAWARPAASHPSRPAPASLRSLSARHHLVMLDIAPRPIPPGWRDQWFPALPVVALDTAAPWAHEADAVVFPGVTCPDREVFAGAGASRPPAVLAGREYVILRREVRELVPLSRRKTLDILAYLYPVDQQESLRAWAARRGVQVRVIDGFEANFLELLAQAKIFLSGFGYSFYEALALHAFPATWPYSAKHGAGAARFYTRLGLPPLIISGEEDLDRILPFLSQPAAEAFTLEDGTPHLVARLAALLTGAPADSAASLPPWGDISPPAAEERVSP